jgi:hypothetical protein
VTLSPAVGTPEGDQALAFVQSDEVPPQR